MNAHVTTAPGATLAGGPAAVNRIMLLSFGLQLTPAQSTSLWDSCAAYLHSRGLGETVEEAQTSLSGRLDTLPRGDVMEAIAQELTGMSWPVNMTGRVESERFAQRIQETFRARGYAPAEVAAAPTPAKTRAKSLAKK